MREELNLSLPERKTAPSGPSKLVIIILLGVLAVGIANLFFAVYRPQVKDIMASRTGLSSETTKALALKLEKQGLQNQAAMAWKEYLSRAGLGAREQAKVWYRIGKLYQEGGTYNQALAAYYRSESFAKVADLEPDINRRIQECLEASGKFTALRYELAERTDVEGKRAGEEVLAEIGTYKITKAEMDRRIEGQIDRQMLSLAPFMTENQRKTQKEALLERLSDPQERFRFLNQLVVEEILYRKAREDKLIENADVKAILRDAERAILARRVLEKESTEQIKITPGDLQLYYEVHKQDYMEPEQAKISHILVEEEKRGKAILNGLEKGQDFAVLAKEISLDESTKNNGGEIDSWVQRGNFIPGIGNSEEATRVIFNTEPGKVAKHIIKSDRGFHVVKVRERKPERQKGFEEVRSEVYRALRSQKEAEVRDRLLAELKERYNVVIHMSMFQEEPTGETEPPKGQKSTGDGHKGT